ncbi:hypothetical protein Q4550_23595, partial [Anaerobacillus sp. 1_MG-2023]|nr:hypothetical protein [Anaerobacillus sp. 1_MG-2023]
FGNRRCLDLFGWRFGNGRFSFHLWLGRDWRSFRYRLGNDFRFGDHSRLDGRFNSLFRNRLGF